MGVIAPGKQPRPVWAEEHRIEKRRGQYGDFFAALAIPEVNGTIFAGRGRNSLAVRTVRQELNHLRVRAQDGKPAARNGVAQVHVLQRNRCHPLAIGAKDHRTVALLPFRQDGDLLAGGSVPQPARAGPP
jgi:hypothetical protein